MRNFIFEKVQSVCDIGGVKVGGQPGVNPTVLIGSMFHKGDKLIEDRKSGSFDKETARQRLKRLEEISATTGIPAMVDIVANSGDEFSSYLEYVAAETGAPICIDAWQPKVRVEAARYAARAGLLQRLVYNSLNPWNKELEAEVNEIAEIGVRHVALCVFDENDKLPAGRMKALEKLLPVIEKGRFNSILVDTTVMNVAAMAFSIQAGFEIKQRFGLPVGCAPANGTYMWEELRKFTTAAGFAGADSAACGIAALLWNDFLFYGPMTGTERAFAAAAAAESIKAMFVYAESRRLPATQTHPLRNLFGKFVEQLESEKG
ncbi:tetrahydromethanopterin S-methyltransferase subunit H [Candidatus Poribacteria bacterium]|nr:tetrahydromethanopterin S-methyltransferase subunit H [Candidatus Poribacteria bacterium]